mgnify:CR=1 FL=1
MENITIKDIAKRLGISTATVSRVLNNSGYASKEMREKVLKEAELMNYKPNSIAQSLKMNRTNKIGLLIPDISNPYFMSIAKGIEDELVDSQYLMVFASGNESKEKELKALEEFSRQRVDCIVLASSGIDARKINDTLQGTIPLILVDRRINGLKNCDIIVEDNAKGAYELVSRVIQLGHTKIGVVAGSLKVSTGLERYEGFLKAMQDHKLRFEEQSIFYGDFTMESGYEAAEFFMSKEREEQPTAIVSFNNTMSSGVLNYLLKHALFKENKLLLASYGILDYQVVFETDEIISVIQQPYDIGLITGQTIKNRLNRPGSEYRVLCLEPSFSFE